MAEWLPVCRVDDLAEGRGLSLDASGVRLALYRHGGLPVALSGAVRTPAARSVTAGSKTARSSARFITGAFRLSDGRCTTIRGESVHRFRCEVRGDEIWVEV